LRLAELREATLALAAAAPDAAARARAVAAPGVPGPPWPWFVLWLALAGAARGLGRSPRGLRAVATPCRPRRPVALSSPATRSRSDTMATYQGGCHCGRIAFEVEGEITAVYDCNCSMCRRRGGLLAPFPRSALTLKTPEAQLSTYRFNRQKIAH